MIRSCMFDDDAKTKRFARDAACTNIDALPGQKHPKFAPNENDLTWPKMVVEKKFLEF